MELQGGAYLELASLLTDSANGTAAMHTAVAARPATGTHVP